MNHKDALDVLMGMALVGLAFVVYRQGQIIKQLNAKPVQSDPWDLSSITAGAYGY